MKWYQSKTIIISLVVIVAGYAILILAAGPSLTDTDHKFIQSAKDYQDALAEIPQTSGLVEYDYANLGLHADEDKALAVRYRGILSGYTISEKLYPYRDELFKALDDEKASADYMISAAIYFKEGQNSTGYDLFNRGIERRESQRFHLEQAIGILRVAEREWWYYLPTG
jgi:hypothetical protein